MDDSRGWRDIFLQGKNRVASIGERREALLGHVAEQPASLSIPVVRIPAGIAQRVAVLTIDQ